ncbi:MAG TPA: class C beta-lactamase [Salinarimonas sp.]|nr:class C beta-lactamase [Salinarimonas sp.]
MTGRLEAAGGWVRTLARLAGALCALLAIGAGARAEDERARLERIVGEAVRPVMAAHDVPGMAVGVTQGGRRDVFTYGVASREDRRPVTESTLFEIGSISKAFTGTLGAYAQASGALSLSDPASRHLPALAGGAMDRVSLLDLATYTAGGLPLQLPKSVVDERTLTAYFKAWRPDHAPGTHRVYSNPSIGLFGQLAARAMGEPFEALIEGRLAPMLGLSRTFVRVPAARMGDYATGYNRDGRPVRVNPAPLAAEAYGVKTNAGDLIRFVEAVMDPSGLDEPLRRAILATRTGYHRVGPMTQGLGWEMYDEPKALAPLLAGNGSDVVFKANAVARLDPPRPPRDDVLVNKTGSTTGFGAYAAFIPARRAGVVLLANRNVPVPDRIRAAHRILMALDGAPR